MLPDNYYRELEIQLESIVGDLSGIISESEVSEVKHFVEVGEYGLALETLGGIITEENYVIPRPVYQKIFDMAHKMALNSKLFDKIKFESVL